MTLHTAELIKAHIDAQPEKTYESWRCSSLGGCLRSHYYQRLGVKPTTPADDATLRKFKAGDLFHDFIQDITIEEVEKQGGVAVKEKELYDKELDLGGRYDLMIEVEDESIAGGILGNQLRILKDIKSQHSGLFHQLTRAAKAMDEWGETPEERQAAMKKAFWLKYPHQVKQLAGYMLLLKRAGTPVDEGVIVRVSKDDLSLAEVHFELTPELEQMVTDEINTLNKHWREKTIPPCTCNNLYDIMGTHYCNYGDPTSEKWVQVPDKNYKKKIRTRCCDEQLIKE